VPPLPLRFGLLAENFQRGLRACGRPLAATDNSPEPFKSRRTRLFKNYQEISWQLP